MLCFLRGMAFVPFLLVTWSSAAFIISYVVAVLSGHVNPFLPYISDTGTTPPESGIFGFMINFSAFLGAATMYTRYKIVEKQNQTSYFSTPVFNLVSLVLGLVGCIGMGIVANFQELAVPVVHDGGALLAFVCGVVYTLLQSIISYKSCPQWNSLSTCHVRLAISAISCAAVVPMIACASLISITKLEWNPKEKDYIYHVVSAICEWTVAFGFIFYFLTFIHDFQLYFFSPLASFAGRFSPDGSEMASRSPWATTCPMERGDLSRVRTRARDGTGPENNNDGIHILTTLLHTSSSGSSLAVGLSISLKPM